VHFVDQSRGASTTSNPIDQTPHHTTRQTNDRSIAHQQPSDKGSSAANRSLMSENGLLREYLDREKFRRKHCEQQIQELHSKLLEIQQELAVAVSSERKKDVMIEQLDKTLAKVVEGWKRHENEKVIVISTLKQERDVQDQSHHKQQEMLLQFEKELEKAVEALTKEQGRAAEAEKEKQEVIEKQAKERAKLLQVLAKEKEKVKTVDEEKLGIVKDKEQAQHKYMEAQRQIEEVPVHNSNFKLISADELGIRCLEHAVQDVLSRHDKEVTMVTTPRSTTWHLSHCPTWAVTKDSSFSLQKEVQRLEMELDTTNREKESLRMEMSLLQARHEASKAKEETERQAELEKQMTQRLEELHQHMSHSESEMRESHRNQIQGINNKYKEEMHLQLEKFHEEIKKKDSKLKSASVEFDERMTEAQDKIASLSNQRQHLENQRQNLTIRMHQMMQAHCDEALRLLANNRSPVKPDTKVLDVVIDSVPKISPIGLSVTSKWQPQTTPTPSVFTKPASTHFVKDSTNSYKHYTPSYQSSNAPVMNYHVTQSHAPTRHMETTTSHFTTQNHVTKHREPTTSQYSSQNQRTLLNRETKPNQHHGQLDSKDTRVSYNRILDSIAAPMPAGYSVSTGYEENSIFSSYLDGGGVNEEMTRSGLDFVPLKSMQDDQDTDSVISALHGSPDSGPLNGTSGYSEMDYQLKVTSSGESNGTLLEQDLEESRMSSMVSPVNQQSMRNQGLHNISEKLHEQEQRQTELNHYVNMLLKRSPGHPVDEGIEQLSDGLMTIPSSVVKENTQGEFFTTKAKVPPDPGYSNYPQHNGMTGSNSVTRDLSQQPHQQAFTKTTAPAAFSIHQPQVPQFQPPTHPQTPPRRDKDPVDQDPSSPQQPAPLTPKQMKQLSKLLSLMTEGQPGVHVPSAQQLFGVLKGMQRDKTAEPPHQTTMDQNSSGVGRTSTKHEDVGHVKRNLDTSFPSRKQKPRSPSVGSEMMSEHPTKTDQHKPRPPSVNGGPPPRSGTDQGLPRHQAPTKASGKHVVPAKVEKPPPTGKQAKSSTAWR
ncbi:hypothetical protein QZH41_012797, partial [Actinostola sp. cb2023]